MFRDRETGGLGALTISNRSGLDAVVKIRTLAPKHTVRAIYVRADSEVKLTEFMAGAYVVDFAMGTDWDHATGDFTQYANYYEFGKTLYFTEEVDGEGTHYSTHYITLNTDPNGSVQRLGISRERFRSTE